MSNISSFVLNYNVQINTLPYSPQGTLNNPFPGAWGQGAPLGSFPQPWDSFGNVPPYGGNNPFQQLNDAITALVLNSLINNASLLNGFPPTAFGALGDQDPYSLGGSGLSPWSLPGDCDCDPLSPQSLPYIDLDRAIPSLDRRKSLPDDDIEITPRSKTRLSGGGVNSLIQSSADRNGLDPALLSALVKQESGYKPGLVSSAGARGLAQVLPSTARGIIKANQSKLSELFPNLNFNDLSDSNIKRILDDPAAGLEIGAIYLKDQLKRTNSTELALASYNGGPGNQYKLRNSSYVKNILSNYNRIKNDTTA